MILPSRRKAMPRRRAKTQDSDQLQAAQGVHWRPGEFAPVASLSAFSFKDDARRFQKAGGTGGKYNVPEEGRQFPLCFVDVFRR